MRATVNTAASRGAARTVRAVKQPRSRSVKTVVSQQRVPEPSAAAAMVAIAVAASLPFLQVPVSCAYTQQWQPVAMIAQEETVVEAPAGVGGPTVEESAVASPQEVADEAPAEVVEVTEVTTPEEKEEALEESVKDEVAEVLEEEIPAVESEIAGIQDLEAEEVAEEVVQLVEEEASIADEAVESGVPAPLAVAKLLDTIEAQLANLKTTFGLK